jgi:hypothetical protein
VCQDSQEADRQNQIIDNMITKNPDGTPVTDAQGYVVFKPEITDEDFSGQLAKRNKAMQNFNKEASPLAPQAAELSPTAEGGGPVAEPGQEANKAGTSFNKLYAMAGMSDIDPHLQGSLKSSNKDPNNPPDTSLKDTFSSRQTQAAGSITPDFSTGYAGFLQRLADHESSGGDYKVVNPLGFLGKYQMGDFALADAGFYHDWLENGAPRSSGNNEFSGTWTDKAKSYGVTSKDDFLNNPEVQEAVIKDYHKAIWNSVSDYAKYVGKEVGGVKVTASGLLAVGHLLGPRGVSQLFGGGGPYDTNEAGIPVDGNKTPATKYLKDMGGLDLTKLLGYNPDIDDK